MKFRRALSFIFVLIMLLSLCGFSSFASEQEAEEVVLVLGTFNNFKEADMESEDGKEYAVTLDLEAGSHSFKIMQGNTAYSNPGTIKDTTSAVSDAGFVMSSEVGAYCTLVALGGSYTFSFNTETSRLKITDGNEDAPAENDSLTVNYGNGVSVANVGDTLSYSVYLTSDKALEDLQTALSYNSEKLSLVKAFEDSSQVNYPNVTKGVFNPDFEGVVTLNGTCVDGYDFTEEKLLLTLDFVVTGTGETALEFTAQEMTASDGTPFYSFSQMGSAGAVLREALEVSQKVKPAEFTGCTITLSGQIAVNFHMALSDALANNENTVMEFTLPNGSKRTVSVNDATKKDDCYVFTCKVAAKEMASAVKAKLISTDYESQVIEYSVKEYADYILKSNDEEYEKAKPLVKAMLNYGAAAQELFNYNIKNPANASLSNAEKAVAEADLTAYNYSLTGKESGVRYYGSKLSLESETAIKHYFYIEDEANIPEITVNGKTAAAIKSDGYYVVKISDILAQKLDEDVVVTVGGITLNYNAFSYGYLAQQGDNQKLKDVVNALFAYNQAAIAY